MRLRNPVLPRLRRFGAGVDVTASGVRLAVLSRRAHRTAPVRLEWLAYAALPHDTVAGAEIVDRAALVSALRDVFGRLPPACEAAALRCAMALPAAATCVGAVPLAQLAPVGCADRDDGVLAGLEPMVLAEAERLSGIERHELAVDWRLEPPSPAEEARGTRPHLVFAYAPRQHLDARIECAAMAGISLSAIDSDAQCALRAMRHSALFELSPDEAYVALWIGPDGVHGWYLAEDRIRREMRFPALEYADLVEALRDLLQGAEAGCAVIAGDVGLLRDTRLSLADIGGVLGCPVLPFECAAFAEIGPPLPAHLLHDPAGAVAFGLALRGVGE